MAEGGVLAQLRWFVRGVTGADAYERYVAHLRRCDPEAPVPTVAEFWRAKHDEAERNPASRCC